MNIDKDAKLWALLSNLCSTQTPIQVLFLQKPKKHGRLMADKSEKLQELSC